jgi:hypothetical protein
MYDDSHGSIKPMTGTEFTGNCPSAALPFAELHRIGYPENRYSSQPHLYLLL